MHYALIVWFVLTGLSVIYVAWDAFTRNPELTVMKLTGPFYDEIPERIRTEPGYGVNLDSLWVRKTKPVK